MQRRASGRDAIRTGVDALLADQRERPGALLVTLASRNGAGQEIACALRPVADVRPVALRPRGSSALHAGIATLIDDVGAELAGLDEAERPERVVVAVVGDAGADGTDSERVRELVERQRRDYAWKFVLVDVSGGAGAQAVPSADAGQPDRAAPGEVQAPGEGEGEGGTASRSDVATLVALAEARLGVPSPAALLAGPGPDGVRAGLRAASGFVSRARESRPWEPVEGFTDDERAAASVPARPPWWRRVLGRAG